MKKFILFLILVLGVTAPVYLQYTTLKNFSFTQGKLIVVEDGDTFYSLGKKLGVSDTFFKLYLKLNPPAFTLQKGKYQIEANKKLYDIIQSFEKPLSEDLSTTLLEGWNIYDIDAELSKMGLIETGNFTQVAEKEIARFASDYTFLTGLTTLEGYLYPDTYSINPNNFSVDAFIRQMLTNFENRVVKKFPQTSPKELHEAVVMASIVEKEEKSESERPIVAGILKKRVEEGWMIGADATVCYPYKLTFNECTPSFIGEHIEDVNTYNTRTKMGLPETPISNPSFSSIDAVIHSEDSPYYYYLHDNAGGIHYGKTNEEHIANKNLYIR